MDQGQPLLLPPGLHSWTSETMRFVRAYDLSAHVIEIGERAVSLPLVTLRLPHRAVDATTSPAHDPSSFEKAHTPSSPSTRGTLRLRRIAGSSRSSRADRLTW